MNIISTTPQVGDSRTNSVLITERLKTLEAQVPGAEATIRQFGRFSGEDRLEPPAQAQLDKAHEILTRAAAVRVVQQTWSEQTDAAAGSTAAYEAALLKVLS